MRQRAFYYTRVNADPVDKDTVYILNVQFFRSTDGGKTTTNIRVPHGDNHDLWISATDNKRMVAGQRRQRQRDVERRADVDGPGHSDRSVLQRVHDQARAVSRSAARSRTTAPRASAARQPRRGEGSLPPIFTPWVAARAATSPPIRATQHRLRRQLRRRLSAASIATPASSATINDLSEQPDGLFLDRHQGTVPVDLSDRVLAARSQDAVRDVAARAGARPMTARAGSASARTSRVRIRRRCKPSGGPITKDQTGVETYAVVFTLAPSRQDVNTIWAGSDDGWVHVTRDGGKNWERVTPPDLPEFARISLIDASPHQNGVAYLAANRYQMGDRKPYVYKTADFGKTWQNIVTGIPDTDFPRVIREDSKRRGLLYVGTEHGLYVSFNDGASWQSLKLNLPTTPIHGIISEERDLVDRHARPRLLRARQHRRAPPGQRRADQQRVVRVRAARSAARPRSQHHVRLLPEQGGVGSEDRVPRRPGRCAALLHRHPKAGGAVR